MIGSTISKPGLQSKVRPVKTQDSGLMGVLQEVRDAWRWRELWLTLGWRDVLSRQDRSSLGPFWISIGMLFVGVCMGTLYSGIMQVPAAEYIPYLVAGYTVWSFISSFVNEGKDVFVSNASAIREIAVPNTVYIFRLLWRSIVIFGFNALVYVAVLAFFGIWPFPALLLLVPAMVLALLNGIGVGMLLGLINARYRDLGQMIPNAMRLVFFVTPILWHAETVTGMRSLFVYLNPLYYFLELMRAPLLGQFPERGVWMIALALTAVGWGITLPVYARWRRRITFWL
jgi:ABC-2 type transport system permease protein/lipopolysaccharide transport system permease protein